MFNRRREIFNLLLRKYLIILLLRILKLIIRSFNFIKKIALY